MNRYKLIGGFAVILSILVFVCIKYGYLVQSAKNFPKNNKPDSSVVPRTDINNSPTTSDPELSYLDLPEGFIISYYAKDIPGARSMALGDDGAVYVGTRQQGIVYAVTNEEVKVIASGLNNPNGVAYHEGDLYVSEIDRIIKFQDIGSHLENPEYSVIYSDLPQKTHHGWRYIKIGPDDRLYIGIGAPCNICKLEDPYGTIASLNLDGSDFRIDSRGIRNTVGFAWQPKSNLLWFTDNGRDNLGDNLPPDELNNLSQGNNFGFPYCYGNNIPDPWREGIGCIGATPPIVELGPHIAALGMLFYQGDMFPPEYQNKVIIAEHGSWNRRVPVGYRLTTVDIDGSSAGNYQPFITGWLDERGQSRGRPVDLLELPDGSVLISDDKSGAIYRLTFSR